MRFGRIFYFVVLFVCIFETARLWMVAPAQMAAHFNIQGNPDRFVVRTQFFWYEIQTMSILILVSVAVQVLLLVVPARLINIPNREYWLVPKRQGDAVGRISSFVAMLFSVILLTMQAVFEISVFANLQTPIFFNAQLMIPVLIIAFLLIGLMSFQLTISFRIPE